MINDSSDLEKECNPYSELPEEGTRGRRQKKMPHKRFLIVAEVKVLLLGGQALHQESDFNIDLCAPLESTLCCAFS
jgi:hypothetical protein